MALTSRMSPSALDTSTSPPSSRKCIHSSIRQFGSSHVGDDDDGNYDRKNNLSEFVSPIYKVMSPNSTQSTFDTASSTISTNNSSTISDQITSTTMTSSFECDYDQDNLHMPATQTTNQDQDDNFGCDSIEMDDVMSIREARRIWDADMEQTHFGLEGSEEDPLSGSEQEDWYASSDLDDVDSGSSSMYNVEMEEDWEVLHEKNVACGGGGKADDDGSGSGSDVVIDW